QARFNVGIRTITVDRVTQQAVYPVGSGIVWDSDAGLEYAECLQKAVAIQAVPPPFELLETLRHDATGYHYLVAHLDRMAASAEHFGWAADREAWRERLAAAALEFPPVPLRVRFLVDAQGAMRVEHFVLSEPKVWRVRLAQTPVD